MPSPRFVQLRGRVTGLRHALLPRKFTPTGLYPDRVHERAKAFRLLVHAEFEAYLEDRVLALVDHKIDRWKTHGEPSIALTALLAYDETSKKAPSTLSGSGATMSVEGVLDAAKRSFSNYVAVRNNGVKETNVLRLVLPAGISMADLDRTWLSSLDSWATFRGDVAHKSAAKLGTKPDPRREYQDAKDLLSGFKTLDALMDGIT